MDAMDVAVIVASSVPNPPDEAQKMPPEGREESSFGPYARSPLVEEVS
jgi:hypothetical protein